MSFGGGPSKSQAQKDAEARQAEDLKKLEAKEDAQQKALKRRRRGRASLISGDEGGVRETLG